MALNKPLYLEPKFSEAVSRLDGLLTANHLVFLIGAGCSHCVGLPLMNELGEKVVGRLKGQSKVILEQVQAQFTGAEEANVEDYLSEITDLLAIAERRFERGAKGDSVTLADSTYSASQLRKTSEEIKSAIAWEIEIKKGRTRDMKTHRSFVEAVHRPSRVGRGHRLVNYLVLNYDTVIEDALSLEKIPYSDGIDGGTTGWWSPSTFCRKDIEARILKLHGSIDWFEFPDDPFPRKIREGIMDPKLLGRRLIWPATTKYRETQLDPYAKLVELAREALTPQSESQEVVLIVCGYSFGDKHINIEIDEALRNSRGKLTVVVFTDKDEPEDKLAAWYKNENKNIREQLVIFAKGGFYHGETKITADDRELEWWKFENITQLLGGRK